jgi:hypothetical protein
MIDLRNDAVISNWEENICYQAFNGAQAFVKKASCCQFFCCSREQFNKVFIPESVFFRVFLYS